MNSVRPKKYSQQLTASPLRVLITTTILFFACALQAQQINLKLDPQQSEVHWTLKDTIHTVHGTFKMKEGSFSFYPAGGKDWGRVEGQVVIDVTSGISGNNTRDGRMHREYLESAKYPTAVFRAKSFLGILKSGPLQTVKVDGILTLRGVDHPMVLDFKVLFDGNKAVAETGFLIPYVDWGIKDPSITLIHVEKQVLVEVSARGIIEFLPQK